MIFVINPPLSGAGGGSEYQNLHPLAGAVVLFQGWAEACKLVFLNSGRVQEGLIIRI